MTVEEFYKLLKAEIKGYYINGSLEGALLEGKLEEIYEKVSTNCSCRN